MQSSHLRQLAVSAAGVALIKQPCFGFHGVSQMGNFWKKTSPEMLYKKNIPKQSKVIDCGVKQD